MEKLLKIEQVNALIVGTSMSAQIVKPFATAAKIPLFCIASVRDVGDEVYTFTTMPLAEDEATRWVAEAKRRGIKRVARLTQSYPSIENHVRALKAEGAPAGIEFIYEYVFDAWTSDFKPAISAAKAASPDVFFVEAFNPALDILRKQLKDAGVGSLASIVALSMSEKPELFEGGRYTDSLVSSAFQARLDERYPGARLATHMMPYAYDSFKMLVEGFESGEDVLTYVRRMTEYQ